MVEGDIDVLGEGGCDALSLWRVCVGYCAHEGVVVLIVIVDDEGCVAYAVFAR